MRDPRIDRLARIVIRHSLRLAKGENLLIDATDDCEEFIVALVEQAEAAGAVPFVQHTSSRLRRAWLLNATDGRLDLWYEQQKKLRLEMDGIVSLRAQDNCYELVDVPREITRLFYGLMIKLGLEAQKPGRRSNVIKFPSRSLAQQCGMSYDAFADFFYQVCTMNFAVLYKEMEPLKDAIDRAKEVHIVAPRTDLRFSIDGIECGISAGTWNIPDGETAMGIVRESAEGTIAYNIPSNHHGFVFKDIALAFRHGRVTSVEANDTERMEAILDTDEGARYIGEFAIGVNPYLVQHMTDTLFDEKMAGSLHFTPSGTDSNGKRSVVHWDIIQSHLPSYGGGEIHLDGKLFRKNGLFVDEKLAGLNPDPLRKKLESDTTFYQSIG